MEYKRGDIFYIEGAKNYAGFGRQTTTGRPAIIVSDDVLNKHSDYVEVVYLTTQDKKELPTHCSIVCKQLSTAMCETIYTVNKNRVGDYVKSCTAKEMAAVNECLLHSLGLDYISDFSEPIEGDMDYSSLQDEIDTLRSQNQALKKQLGDAGKSDHAIAVERDLYKTLYEQLLNKVVA